MVEDAPKEEPSPKPEEKKEPEKASLAQEIEGAVRKVLGNLLDSGEVTVEEKGAGTTEKPGLDEKPPTTRQEERTMEELVRAEVEKLKGATPPEPEKTAPPKETPPETFQNKMTRFIWGEGKGK